MTTLTLETPRALAPLLPPARYKGAHGGRGGSKSHFFAGLLVERAVAEPGFRAVCVREVQQSLKEYSKRLLEDKIEDLGVGHYFRILQSHIETPGDGIIIFQGMQNHTAESIKSLEGYDVAWVEEAHVISQRSLDLLRPTIRKPGSELWFSWNPISESDPVDALLRGPEPPPDSVIVEVNHRDNPWFPDVLRSEMDYDLAHDPDKYAHVWEGGYRQLTEARIIKNWRVAEFEPPTDEDVLRFGADWGYSIDPSVLVRLFVRGRQIFIDYEAYMIGCEVDHLPFLFGGTEDEELNTLNAEAFETLPAALKGTPGIPGARRWPIRADSARPETIAYLKRHGFPSMRAAKKGPGSIEEGIQRLQSYEIIVHPRCKRMPAELASWSYRTDRHTGDVLPIPEDKDNHFMDSTRYATEGLRGSSGWGVA